MSALWLARGAVVALLAYPAGAQVIGQETAIMGGEAGFLRPSGGPAIVIDAMPYTRTVTCSDYTLTGSAPGAGAVSWSASPSGDSGVCTGTTSWTCVINVDPDASGEGVETITVTQGVLTDTETIGFYVDGEHSCFLSQSVNGLYNSGLSNNDAVATWENLGTSALDVTQGTAGAQPTFRTAIVGGSPVVRCDGGDRLAAATALDWAFMNDSADWSADVVFATSSANPNAAQVTFSTQATAGGGTSRGHSLFYEDRAALPANDRARTTASNGTVSLWSIVPADGGLPAAKFNQHGLIHDDDGGAGADAFQYSNFVLDGNAIVSAAYSALAPAGALTLCAETDGGLPFTGDLFRSLVYTSALDATQRAINLAVDQWALGGTLPVTP